MFLTGTRYQYSHQVMVSASQITSTQHVTGTTVRIAFHLSPVTAQKGYTFPFHTNMCSPRQVAKWFSGGGWRTPTGVTSADLSTTSELAPSLERIAVRLSPLQLSETGSWPRCSSSGTLTKIVVELNE
jgi:hypothetical protein